MSFCQKHKYKLIFVAVALIVIALCIAYFFIIRAKISSPEERGTFGDMFGTVGALFSGLAFAGVIVTMLQQKEELELQRKELAQTNLALESQRKEMEAQNKTIMLQRFESTFFNMLHIEQDFLQSIKYTEKSKTNGIQTTVGRVAMMNLYDTWEVLMDGDLFYRQNPDADFGTVLDKGQAWNSISLQLEHYFRFIYQILKFVDGAQYLSDEEKYNYSCLLNSQLSPHELLLLFYHSISNNGKKTLKPLVEKYAFMQNIKKELLFSETHYNLLTPEAYCHQQSRRF